MVAQTGNIAAHPTDGWQLIATDPESISVTANDRGRWAIAITQGGAPTGNGEVFNGRESWVSDGFIGELYVRAIEHSMDFGYTVGS